MFSHCAPVNQYDPVQIAGFPLGRVRRGIAPIAADGHGPRMGRKPAAWTAVDRYCGRIRVDMQALFDRLAPTTVAPAA
jgi:hypothetical protein